MKKSYLFAGVSILLWSTVATVAKLLLGSLNSFQILSVTTLFAGVFLLVVNLVTGNIKKLKAYRPKDVLITVLIGLPGTFFYYVFYYTGTSLMPASQAFIINYLWPIMSVLFACIVLKEKMTPRKGIAIALSFVGVIIVTGGALLSLHRETLLGAVCCVLGAVSYGVFTAYNQKYRYDRRISFMIFYFTSFLLTMGINVATDNLFTLSPVQVLGLGWNGIFAVAIAGICWMVALESGKTAKISNLAYITPFLSVLWTAIFLKEKMTVYSLVGLAVIILGILIQMGEKKEAGEKRLHKEEETKL